MVRDMPISDVRREITGLNLQPDDVVAVTNRNKRTMALLSWDLYEGFVETLEVLADDDLGEQLRRGLEDLRKGDLVDLANVKHEFGL